MALPRREKETAWWRSLATVCEVHQKALAAAATLKEEIERLSHTWNYPEVRVRSKSRDCQGCSKEEWKRRCYQVQVKDPPTLNHPSGPKTGSGEEGATTKGSDLEDLLELRLVVASILKGLPETSKDKGNGMPLEPTITEFSQWVLWRADKCETPGWWAKLLAVPEMEDHKKLAREVQASFWLPQWIKELGMKGANLQAPPVPPCLHQQMFMLPAQSIYACRDIREIPQDKVVAYGGALQHWAEDIFCLLEGAMSTSQECEGVEGGGEVVPLLLQ